MKMSVYFFQVIHNYIIEDKRLELPKMFVRKYGEELSENAVINDPSGKIWLVQMRKTPEGEIFLENGWQGFMDYFSLRSGHFLIFRYYGSSHFHVYICDMSACEIEYPFQTNNAEGSHYEKVSTDAEGDDFDVSVQYQTRGTPIAAKRAKITGDTASGSHESSCDKSESPLSSPPGFACPSGFSSPPGFACPPGFPSPPGFAENNDSRNVGSLHKQNEDNQGKPRVFNYRRKAEVISISSGSESEDDLDEHLSSSESESQDEHTMPALARKKYTMPIKRKYGSTVQSKESVRKEANALINSEISKFKIVMQPSYVDNRNCHLVHVPAQFAKQFLTRRSQSTTLRTSDGRVWVVECSVYDSSGKYEATFRKGWKEFKLHNHLKEGDICEFELVDRDNLCMEVTFSRV